MPRSAGFSTPKYRRHRSSGQAVVTITGRVHYLRPWKTKASLLEYDQLIGEWLAAGRPTTPIGAADLTIAEAESIGAADIEKVFYYVLGFRGANALTAKILVHFSGQPQDLGELVNLLIAHERDRTQAATQKKPP